ncbi:MAG TPA: response regulator [Anaerolineae bacterium]|nr:response regulator [Anaerolineae bacterium]
MNPIEASFTELQGHTILVVDDNAANLEVVGEYLVKCGLQVMVARTGEAGLALAQQHRPDLILLDVMLPGIDGFETCRRLKTTEHTQEIPVIFMTIVTQVEDKVQGFQVGGVDYITKPFQREEVLARVATHLKIRDLTRSLRRAKEQAEAARETAEAADRAKSTFMAHVSHELRTPLNGILGYAQVLQRDKALTLMQRNGLNVIQQSGEQLLTFINDILDLSRTATQTLELHPHEVNLPVFLEGVAGITYLRAQGKGLNFVLDIPPMPQGRGLPATVRADESRLRQVLINLLTNAVKFTAHGSVTLRVEELLIPDATPNVRGLRFSVQDTGIGIPADQLEKIFEPFEQTEAGQQQGDGAGLGLPIARRIVRLMSSEIHVASTVGAGSTFWFDVALPIIHTSAQEIAPPSHEITGYSGPRRTVLVTDPEAYQRTILRNLLSPLGFEVIEAADAHTAIPLAQQNRPDVLLINLVMPALTNFATVRQIRQALGKQEVVIIGISASMCDVDESQAALAGCDACLPQPLSFDDLLRLLQEQLHFEWQYTEIIPVTPAEIVAPPQAKLHELYKIAQLGNMRKIRQWADGLAAQDGRYQAFADTLQKLALSFQKKQIVAFIEQYLEVETHG